MNAIDMFVEGKNQKHSIWLSDLIPKETNSQSNENKKEDDKSE